jgi:nuclear pore complex protein Nup155
VTAKRKEEAYSVIESSDDEVFQTDLYDWYLTQGQADKLLGIQSRYVVTYLQRKSSEDIRHADLLWRYFSQWQRHHDAAKVQYILADSDFDLNLNQRIGYLSQAKANASIFTMGVPKHERYELQRQIQELVDCAMIQSDILEKLQDDERLNPDTRPAILKKIDGKILTLTELYNGYADEASYYDICLLIYQAADHRNPIDVRNTWRNHLESTHSDTLKKGFPLPYEAIASTVRTLGARLELSESTFPITELLPLLERYAFEFQQDVGPKTWVIDTFLDLKVPCETLFSVLEGMYYVDEAPFQGNNKRFIAEDMIYVARRWYEDTCRSGHVLGGDAVANEVLGSLETVMSNGIIGGEVLERAREVKLAIEGALRY